MGIKNPKFYIEKNIAEHKEKYHSHYDRFLNGESPISVTWFSVNPDVSTEDVGYENVESTTSEARKYNKINNLMIYGFDVAEVQLSMGDKGLSADGVSGTITLLPETIEPKPEDKFIVEHMGSNIVFRVTRVSFPLIKSNNFWAVEYELDKTTAEADFLESNIVDTYETIYDNIGSKFKVVVRKDELMTLSALDVLKSKFIERYIELYYQCKTNAFVFEDPDFNEYDPSEDPDFQYTTYIYNKYLHKFIIDTHIFSDLNSFNSVAITQDVNLRRGFSIDYGNTLYGIFEDKDKGSLDKTLTDFFIINIVNVSGSLFDAYPETYIQGDLSTDKYRKGGGKGIIYYEDMIPKELYDTITDNETPSNNVIYNIISNYLNNKIMDLSELTYLKSYKFHYKRDDFMLLPFIIFIIRYNINYIMSKERSVNNIS